MSYDITTDSDKLIITVCYKGDVSIDTWLAVSKDVAELGGGSTLRNAQFIVADFTNATLAKFDTNDLTGRSVDLLLKNSAINPDITVIVIAPDSLEYGLMRMLQSSVDGRSGWESHLVKSRDECVTLLTELS